MKIKFFFDCGDEPWALFADGHVSFDLFKAAVARYKESDVDQRDLEKAEMGHFYMRQLHGETNVAADEIFDEEYPWHWCKAEDLGAVAVTAFKF